MSEFPMPEPDKSQNDVTVSQDISRDPVFEKSGLRILKSLRRIIRAVDIHSRKLNTEFNVTSPQMICLYSLAQGGQMTLSDLVHEVNLSASTVNGIVDRLEGKELVRRERSTKDRRKVYLQVTEAGKKLTVKAPEMLQDQLKDSLRRLPELEQAAIALSLERVVKLMEIEHLEASPNLMLHSQPEAGEKTMKKDRV